MNTAGRAILFAGATVVIALLGMFALGVSFLYGVAIAASLGVLLVLAASLTLLPALLMFTGKRVGRRAAAAHRPREPGAGFWTPLGRAHPAPARVGRARIHGAAARAGRAGTRPAARGERLWQRPHHADDPACVRPARRAASAPASTGRCSSPSVCPSAGDTGGLARFTTHASAHARDRLRRGAAAQPRPRHGRDRRLSDRRRRRAPRRRVSSSACAAMSCRRSQRRPARRSTSAARPRSRSTSRTFSPASCRSSSASSSCSRRFCCSSSSGRC